MRRVTTSPIADFIPAQRHASMGKRVSEVADSVSHIANRIGRGQVSTYSKTQWDPREVEARRVEQQSRDRLSGTASPGRAVGRMAFDEPVKQWYECLPDRTLAALAEMGITRDSVILGGINTTAPFLVVASPAGDRTRPRRVVRASPAPRGVDVVVFADGRPQSKVGTVPSVPFRSLSVSAAVEPAAGSPASMELPQHAPDGLLAFVSGVPFAEAESVAWRIEDGGTVIDAIFGFLSGPSGTRVFDLVRTVERVSGDVDRDVACGNWCGYLHTWDSPCDRAR